MEDSIEPEGNITSPFDEVFEMLQQVLQPS